MILYFSGTGNSEYTARQIGRKIDDETVNLFYKIRNNDYSEMKSERPWIITAPTYAWRIPHILEKWFAHTSLIGSKDVYFVMTCGGSIGNAGRYLEKLCAEKNMNYCGCAAIVMPENYIALFSTPARDEALQIIDQAESVINSTALRIRNGEKLPRPNISLGDKINSGIINAIFYPLFVHAKKFYTTDSCVSCGMCADVCPLKNISMKDKRPSWGDNCTHCMACICKCPKEAIEYGKRSKGLPRYVCPKEL